MRLADLIGYGNIGTYIATESAVKQTVAKLEKYIERGDQRFDRSTRLFHADIAIGAMIRKGEIMESDPRAQVLSAFSRKYLGREPAWYVREGVTIQRS